MKQVLRIALLAAGGIFALCVIAVVSAASIGSRSFRQRFESERDELLRRGREATPRTVDAARAAQLPAPVQRYLQVTRALGNPGFRVARLRQRGSLRAAADKAWMPFEAEQAYSVDPPGFVWFASAEVAPLVTMLARDKFEGAKGHMLVRLLGTFTVADAKGERIDQGAGLRHWGEIISFPEAVLHPSLTWEAMDAKRARLRIAHDGLQMEAVVEFDASGLPAAFHAQRYRDVGGTQVLTPWSGHSRGWKMLDGRLFPTEWESVWHLEQGDFVAVKMNVLSVGTE